MMTKLSSIAFTSSLCAVGLVLLSGCAPENQTAPPVAAVSETGGAGASDAASESGSAGEDSADSSADAVSYQSVIAAYPDCAALAGALTGYLDNLALEDSDNDPASGMITCVWQNADAALDGGIVSLQVDLTETSEAQVTDAATIESIGAVETPDAVLAAHHGVAYSVVTSGQVSVAAHVIEVPGITVNVTQSASGVDTTIDGASAVTISRTILGL